MNPILVELGPITIYWYTIMIFIAFLIGGTLALNEAKKWKISEDFMINLFFYMMYLYLYIHLFQMKYIHLLFHYLKYLF